MHTMRCLWLQDGELVRCRVMLMCYVVQATDTHLTAAVYCAHMPLLVGCIRATLHVLDLGAVVLGDVS
jgi:hypothetical protein